MTGKIFLKHYRILLSTAALAAVCFTDCTRTKSQAASSSQQAAAWQAHRLNLYNDSIYPLVASKVQTGDMVTRLGTDITSEMLRQLNLADKSYSHCGIASVENDTIFIYHAIGGEFNPDQHLKREPLYSFCHPDDNKAVGVYACAMTLPEKLTLVKAAQQTFQQEIPFDMAFDYATNDRLYCAEFVAKCYSQAMQDSGWFQLSTIKNFRYVAVDNLSHSKKMTQKMQVSF